MSAQPKAFVAMLGLLLAVLGCSGQGPVAAPAGTSGESAGALTATVTGGKPSQTHLWGYYDVYVDVDSQTATAVLNRQAMTTWNVVALMNKTHAKLVLKINGTPIGSDYVDIDVDVSITNPAASSSLNAYDVRCVFMGDGAAYLRYNSDLDYAVKGIDQFMQDFNMSGDDEEWGNPDGYARWFNSSEFLVPGLLGYTPPEGPGHNYEGSATLNPYKYYADGLGKEDDLWTWLNDNASSFGRFTAGSTNTRNFYIRFPNYKGLRFSYAILASWLDEITHPANAPEAPACKVTVTPDLYWVPPAGSDKGGDLILDISVWGWLWQPSTIYVESTVLSAVYELTPAEMTPIAGDWTYSTYHTEIIADNVTGLNGNEFWVILEYPAYDYTNYYGVPNLADTDPLAAFFRYDLYVNYQPFPDDPVCDLEVVSQMPHYGDGVIEFDATGSYDPDGTSLTYEWDFDGDKVFGEDPDDNYSGDPSNPTHAYTDDYSGLVWVRVTDEDNQRRDCFAEVEVLIFPAKNIPLRETVDAYDLALDPADGDLLILYSDGEVWRYLESDRYQTGSVFIQAEPGADRVDVSPNGCAIVGGDQSGALEWAASYDSEGALLSEHAAPEGAIEVIGFSDEGSAVHNQHGVLSGWTEPSFDFALLRFSPPNYQDGTGAVWTDEYGMGRLHSDLVRGCEVAKDSGSVCFLEASPEFSVERFTYAFDYEGVHWGGSKSDSLDGFNDPRDIARDSQDDVYVLDLLSTAEPAVKKYGPEGEHIGFFGDSESISGEPLRIEGSDYSGNIFVLHSDGLSIFFPHEIP